MSVSKFALYAAEGSNRKVLGKLVKYVKGEWQMGPNKDLISPDKRFVAVMDTLTVGWMKWVDGEQVDGKMGLVADGFRPVRRDELGDLDRKDWKVAKNGDRIDPWQKTTMMVFASATAPHDLYTFTTNSEGGKAAVSELCAAHARTTEGAGQYLVVTLGGGEYQHREYGRVDVPVFEIVGEIEAGPFNALVAEARGGAGFLPAAASALTSNVGPIAITGGEGTWDDPPSPDPDDPGPDYPSGDDCPL